jgi:hypothetical protein
MEALLEKVVAEIDRAVKYGVDRAPDLERSLFDIMDKMFSQKQVMRQMVMISVLQVLLLCYSR